MRVLVACEFSGTVREAFRRRGHDAWSCDLLPTETPGPHLQGDVLDVLGDGWDLLIGHPPCTYLCGMGVWWNHKRPERWPMTYAAQAFVEALWGAPVRCVAIENPVGFLNRNWMPPSQVIQPWQFGHEANKPTCLWLRNLPTLTATQVVGRGEFYLKANGKRASKWSHKTCGNNKEKRARIASRTFTGIAEAMADQWGGALTGASFTKTSPDSSASAVQPLPASRTAPSAKTLRVLVGCEFSGVVREAFRRRGHDAWSCDLLPAEDSSPHHLQCDVLTVLDKGWDIAIFHPPCTYLTNSAAWAFGDGPYHQRVKPDTLVGAARRAAREAAVAFVKALAEAPCPRIAIENPVGHLSSAWRRPDQTIQPWQFGHDASKSTCLWLKGLPRLAPTAWVPPRYACRCCGPRFEEALGKYGCPNCGGEAGAARPVWANQTPSGRNGLSPSPDRWKRRSVTYGGVADAMAEQWGRAETLPDRGNTTNQETA